MNIRKRILTKTWTVREIQKVNLLGKSKEDQMLTFVRSNINIQMSSSQTIISLLEVSKLAWILVVKHNLCVSVLLFLRDKIVYV